MRKDILEAQCCELIVSATGSLQKDCEHMGLTIQTDRIWFFRGFGRPRPALDLPEPLLDLLRLHEICIYPMLGQKNGTFKRREINHIEAKMLFQVCMKVR